MDPKGGGTSFDLPHRSIVHQAIREGIWGARGREKKRKKKEEGGEPVAFVKFVLGLPREGKKDRSFRIAPRQRKKKKKGGKREERDKRRGPCRLRSLLSFLFGRGRSPREEGEKEGRKDL